MKNKNKYGFYSGGFITDKLDRIALDAINKAYPMTSSQLWFTSTAKIDFKKQLCNLKDISYECGIWPAGCGSIYVLVELYQSDTIIAVGNFAFVKTNKNYCAINKPKRKRQ